MSASSTSSTASSRSSPRSPAARLRTWYGARAPRERRLLVLAAAVVLGGTLIAAAERLVNAHERLTRSLPAARLAYLGMEQDSLGLAALRLARRAAPAPDPAGVAACRARRASTL